MDLMTIVYYSGPAFCLGLIVGGLLMFGIIYAVKEEYKLEKKKQILK